MRPPTDRASSAGRNTRRAAGGALRWQRGPFPPEPPCGRGHACRGDHERTSSCTMPLDRNGSRSGNSAAASWPNRASGNGSLPCPSRHRIPHSRRNRRSRAAAFATAVLARSPGPAQRSACETGGRLLGTMAGLPGAPAGLVPRAREWCGGQVAVSQAERATLQPVRHSCPRRRARPQGCARSRSPTPPGVGARSPTAHVPTPRKGRRQCSTF
jgi:hypothetical protein